MAKTTNEETEVGIQLRELVCFNFYRGWRGITEYYRKLLPEGISAQQSYILEICDREKGVLVSHIAQALEIDISAISSMLRRMENTNLIRRKVQPENRRQTVVYLTKQGEALREKIREDMMEADIALRKVIPQPMIDGLIKIVDRVRILNDQH